MYRMPALARRLALASTAMLAGLIPATGQVVNDMAMQLLAGSPWQMTMGNGRSGRLTPQADGSGVITMGPMRMALTWSARQEGLCMTTQRRGERCIALVRDDDGFVGAGPDGSLFRLSK